MKILNNSTDMPSKVKCDRLSKLIARPYDEVDNIIETQIHGASMVWARAKFVEKASDGVSVN